MVRFRMERGTSFTIFSSKNVIVIIEKVVFSVRPIVEVASKPEGFSVLHSLVMV